MKNRFTKLGAALMLVGMLSISTLIQDAKAQEESKFSMDVTLNSDIFFGFYPFFQGAYSINDKTDFTFYGILWSGGTGSGWGNWTEFGIGFSTEVSEGISITPQIGLLNGSLTSGLGVPVLGEGIVPNLTIGIDKSVLEGEIYLGYYYGLNHGNSTTLNFLHYWVNGGVKLTPMFSAGLHFEQLRFAGGSETESDAAYNYYVALGPYIQFADPKGGAFTRFTAGGDLRPDEMVTKSEWRQPSFFKLTVGYSF
ncbi:DUF6733 family protein [Aquiflexum sp.]|uniref:DUF6733 family protein n=1 Tax=Aquiflexum sp. TaxID=1872584 RepID=UPI0035946737